MKAARVVVLTVAIAAGAVAAILPSGMRAIATGISPETGADDFIPPNDRTALCQGETRAVARSLGTLSLALPGLTAANAAKADADSDKPDMRRGGVNVVRFGVSTMTRPK
jgi:Flp pilus assembly protein CpaB